ncbi:MAG: hypothetical protein JNG86_21620, partial [Verrucomicrobiaceae bacterium]|nr:hypothetical protein [Verrucomicrobiaceae bacterium]
MLKNAAILVLSAALAALLIQRAGNTRPGESPRTAEIASILAEAHADPGLEGAAIGFCL